MAMVKYIPAVVRKNPKATMAIVISVVGGAFVGGGITYWHCKKNPTPSNKNIVYVFYSMRGKPLTLPEKEVCSIKQMSDDGVQPSAIAEKYGLTPAMVCRIINC
jgi:hypothetical protein